MVCDIELLGYYLFKGINVIVYLGMNYCLLEIWIDLLIFDLEWFIELCNEYKWYCYVFMLFGGGVYKCIGMVFD